MSLNSKIDSRLIMLLLAVILITSCNTDQYSPVNTKNNKQIKSNFILFGSLTSSVSYPIYLFKARTDLYIEANNQTYKYQGGTDSYNYAYFPCDAGTVKVNNITITQDNQYSGNYTLFNNTFDLDGNYVKISVTGSANIPGFSDSVKSPINFANMTNPNYGDTISASNDLYVTWNSEDNSGMAVVIDIAAATPESSSINYNQYFSDDTGSFTIPSSFLGSFKKGITQMTLQRGYYTVKTLSNGKNYGIAIYSQHTITFRLTN
jgi:hypothetical protein